VAEVEELEGLSEKDRKELVLLRSIGEDNTEGEELNERRDAEAS